MRVSDENYCVALSLEVDEFATNLPCAIDSIGLYEKDKRKKIDSKVVGCKMFFKDSIF